MARSRSDEQLRRRIAVEAARLITESGLRDFHAAKRKAARHLGIGDDAALPGNAEVDAALREHLALFDAGHPDRLRALRIAALEAMRHLSCFEPRLVGAVLDGSADRHSVIALHLFAGATTDVLVALMELGIGFEEDSRVVRYGNDDQRMVPVLRFDADGHRFDLSIFDRDDLRQPPLDRVHGRPMQRADRAAVLKLVDTMNAA